MNRTTISVATLACVALATCLWPEASHAPVTAETLRTQSAMTIHIDPSTGALITDGSGGSVALIDENLRAALSTSQQGLVEVSSTTANGGTMVVLDGRFRNAQIAVLNADGTITAPCVAGDVTQNTEVRCENEVQR